MCGTILIARTFSSMSSSSRSVYQMTKFAGAISIK